MKSYKEKEKKALKKLPEQENSDLNLIYISSEFSTLIREIPAFWGIITKEGNSVKMPFNELKDYES